MSSATIRMYNVGFGDCFLVRLATVAGERTVLIDCGSHPKGPGPWPILDVAQSLVDGLGPVGQRRIDVVVSSHRHADHVSGFAPAVWSGVEVSEVWLPWIDNPDDPEAKPIRDAQQNLAAALTSSLSATAANRVALEMVANSVMNKTAMSTLQHGFAGHPLPRYLPVAGGPDSFETPALPGVKVHVLGPSRNPEVIREMDPPAGQSYLASLSANSLAGQALRPFEPRMASVPGRLSRDMQRVKKLAEFNSFDLAVALEDAVNGTSLMLAFEIGSEVLLFPGDAQWGTWQAAMANPTWAALLRRVSFLKVGHHGSHNATPVDFVEELLPDGIAAMVSTRLMTDWPNIPRGPLLDKLAAKGVRLARSDQLDTPPAGFSVDPDKRWIEISI